MNRPTFHRLALAAVVLSAGAGAVRSETTDCTAITSLPATISARGAYCLTSSLSFAGPGTGPAILVEGPTGVTLDLNGHVLEGAPGAYGILVRNATAVTLRNGILAGFDRAVLIDATSTSTRVEDLHIEGNNFFPTISSQGIRDVIQRNWITRGHPAIRTYGHDARVTDNDVVLSSIAIDVNSTNAIVEDNRVTRYAVGAGTIGIRMNGTARLVAARNTIMGYAVCLEMNSATRYRENVTNDCATTYSGGVSAGSNY
jgi:hypothetical protein